MSRSQQLKTLEGHLVLLILMPGYRQSRIGQLTYQGDKWVLSNLYDDQALPLRIPADRILKVSQVQTWDVYDAVIYLEIGG